MKYSAALCRPSDGETSMNDFDNEILPTDPDEGEEITERVAGRETYEWVRSLVGAVLVITLLFTFVVRLMGVDGHSMVPTLQDGDYVALLILGQGPDDSTADEAKLAQDEAAKVDAAWQDIFGSAANQLVVK